jgi:hypothetical protein
VLSRLERAFERIVEGSIAGVFRLRVQPAEIGRQLERAMLERRVTSVGTTLAPNLYLVRLHPDDADTFSGWEDALCREMETWLAEVAYARGLATIGAIRVQIAPDPDVARRSVQAHGRFSDTPPIDGATAAKRTRTRYRLVPAQPLMPAIALSIGILTVGRGDDNDVVLPDPEVSRRHARIECHGQACTVVDLGSTNRTWVNGVAVEQAGIEPGDELRFGGVRFTVKHA